MSDAVLELPVVSSLVVQARPEALQAVTHFVESCEHAEIHGNDGHSKLVLVVEMADDTELSDFMRALGEINGVITVNIVFHHTDSLAAADEEPLCETAEANPNA
ncbi:MAG: chaperone NapD [Arenicellales bacterium WSBS_2016_MAG_OTU3]